MRRVAIQGFSGCFHEQAARDFYRSGKNEDIAIVECATFGDLFSALAQGRADAAVMAIETTISGGLLPNFDLLRKNPQKIKGEVYLQIHQNLMALPGQKMEDIREVRTHYMAINQTRAFFERECPWIKMVESEDTAKSAADIARERLQGVGAVASSLAAQEFGLEILAPQIETYHEQAVTMSETSRILDLELQISQTSQIHFLELVGLSLLHSYNVYKFNFV